MWAAIIAVVSVIWDAVQAAADYVIISLAYAYQALKSFAGFIWDAARFTYQDILKPIGQWLHDGYERLKAIYDRVIAPVVKWANRLTCAIRKVYRVYFQPVLSAIDGIRRLLELLALLHVPFAQQLDDVLKALEAKITGPIQLVIGVINGLVNRIESYVLTVDNLFRRATLIGSIGRNLNSIVNMHWNRAFSTFTEKQGEGPVGMDDYTPVDERLQLFDSITAGDDANTGIDVEAALVNFEAYARGEAFSMWTQP